MGTLLIKEENEGPDVWLSYYGEGTLRWREKAEAQNIATMLSAYIKEKRLSLRDAFVWVLPEEEVVRRLYLLPKSKVQTMVEHMAANKLEVDMKTAPHAVRAREVGASSTKKGLYAAVGVRTGTIKKRQALAKSYGARLRFVGECDAWVAESAQGVEAGYYYTQHGEKSVAFAVTEGRVIDARCGMTSQSALREAHEALKGLGLSPFVASFEAGDGQKLDEAALLAQALRAKALGEKEGIVHDKKFWALFVLCVVLPLLALQLEDVGPKEEDTQTVTQTVVQSDYSTLISEAYAQQTERVTLLSQVAENSQLAITGSCKEALDAADYMKRLEASEAALSPVLLELTKVQEEKAYHYTFTIQISQKGGGAS